MSQDRDISIEYCVEWNYEPHAVSLAAEIQETLGITPRFIKSGGGVFEVSLDDELLYSKKALGRFPEPGEVVEGVKAKL